MKMPFSTATSTGEDFTKATSPIKVCIHVLSEGRSDVRVMRAATTLAEAGFAVSVVDLVVKRTSPVEEDISNICLRHVIVPSWQTARRFEPWFFIIAIWTFICSVLRLILVHADIYHASELTALPACFIAARLLRKPLIFEIYDLQFPVPETRVAFWRQAGAYLYSLLLPQCMGVIATSPSHAQAVRDRYHVPEVTLVRNVPRYRKVQESDRLCQFLGLSSDVRIALYQGNLQSDRSLHKLVYAAAFLEQDIVIVMMGKDTEGTRAQLETLIASEGVADRVKIIPPVPYEDLLIWTASADIGLIVYALDYSLNVQKMLPNKLFEFLMAGLPVLASPLEAVEEVINTHDVGKIVSSLAPADIGAAINSMLADQEALARMRRNALKAAKDEFHWEKESQELIRLYQNIWQRTM